MPEDDFISIKEVVDSDGIGYCVDRYLHSEHINDEWLASLIAEVKVSMNIIEKYISDKALEQLNNTDW